MATLQPQVTEALHLDHHPLSAEEVREHHRDARHVAIQFVHELNHGNAAGIRALMTPDCKLNPTFAKGRILCTPQDREAYYVAISSVPQFRVIITSVMTFKDIGDDTIVISGDYIFEGERDSIFQRIPARYELRLERQPAGNWLITRHDSTRTDCDCA